MTVWWQNIPTFLDPIVFTAGSFSLRWYAVFFVLGWFAAFRFLRSRIRKGDPIIGKEALSDLATTVFVGALLGGRLGYALFYDPSLLSHPMSLVSPFDSFGTWRGIWGMSFHGALCGVLFGSYFFARSRKIGFWRLTDFIVPAVPIAIFFGRIGNFLNLELVGRTTERSWGMYFPGFSGLRHPSQLYEAFFEGVLLFAVLFMIGKRRMREGYLSLAFLFLYGSARFMLEFFREPDAGSELFFGWMTRGQSLSFGMIVFSIAISGFFSKQKDGILNGRG
ncbi:MAG: prolipoprotein diacylglyceryl transferase [Candidatus Moranbacteria bacterium]|nr:prolipoprotein diacylglyceryl transferase [Candidatus Moranbacteria bacterium]